MWTPASSVVCLVSCKKKIGVCLDNYSALSACHEMKKFESTIAGLDELSQEWRLQAFKGFLMVDGTYHSVGRLCKAPPCTPILCCVQFLLCGNMGTMSHQRPKAAGYNEEWGEWGQFLESIPWNSKRYSCKGELMKGVGSNLCSGEPWARWICVYLMNMCLLIYLKEEEDICVSV